MSFLQKLNEYVLSLEQDENQPVADAPEATPAAKPEAAKKEVVKQEVAPEGYTELVRLLAKALVMNVPPDAIDGLFSQKITGENAENIREGLEELINTSTNYQDNPERIENPHFKDFLNSINENNFYSKLKHIITSMKKYSNDIDIK
jgi:hypothetical protein